MSAMAATAAAASPSSDAFFVSSKAARALLMAIGGMYLAGGEAAAPPSRAISVEIQRRPPPPATPLRARARRRRSLSAGAAVEISNCENVEYTGVIGLGTPPQQFNVVLNTGSYSLWVVSAACDSCGSSEGYDSSASSSYEADGSFFSVAYDDGSDAEGIISVDTLAMGGLATTVTFGEMSKINLDGCTQVDGVLGMGISDDDGQNVFEDMLDAGVVDVPIFSFYMGNVDTDSPTGVLTLGGVNQTHYQGCLEWVAVSEQEWDASISPEYTPDIFWSVMLKDLKVGSESVTGGKEATAFIDTGASLVQGPYADVGFLAEKIGATCLNLEDEVASEVDCVEHASDIDIIVMDCAAGFDDINFFFGGNDFALTPKELLQPLDDFMPPGQESETALNTLCLFGMVGSDFEDMWILGDSFLRTFYTAYNVRDKVVGFAPSTVHRTSPDCAADNILVTSSVSTSSPGGDEGGEGEGAASKAGFSSSSDSADRGGNKNKIAGFMVVGVGLLLIAAFLVVVKRRQWLRGDLRWQTLTSVGNGRGGGGGIGGGGGGGFEMSSKSSTAAARHGSDFAGPEEDFLQEEPDESGSGSHFHRSGGGGSKRVVRAGSDDAEDELVEGGVGGGRAVKPEGFGRLLSGPQRAGFAPFKNEDDGDDGAGDELPGRGLGDL